MFGSNLRPSSPTGRCRGVGDQARVLAAHLPANPQFTSPLQNKPSLKIILTSSSSSYAICIIPAQPNYPDGELLKATNGLSDAKKAYTPPPPRPPKSPIPSARPSDGVVRQNENKCLLLHCSGAGDTVIVPREVYLGFEDYGTLLMLPL